MGEKGISGSTLKLIAIITMLIDHIGAVLMTASPNYDLYRTIGRVSFPIFCFLLVEGYVHTHDVKRYAARLLLFAAVSEIPFDLAFSRNFFNPYDQNVFFTLVIGLGVLYATDWLQSTAGQFMAILSGMAVAVLLQTDYSYMGVVAILVLYRTRGNRLWQVVCGALMFLWEPPAIAAFVPIYFYNGKRGISMKYFFYAFYPAHLLILVLIRFWLQSV